MNLLNPLPCTAIRQWEEHGASLVAAFKEYRDLCLGLGTELKRGSPQRCGLVSRIDSALEVHTRISHYLEESNSALARARNKLSSPFSKISQELLLEIFLNAVFDRSDFKKSPPPSMEQDVWSIYRRLYNLMGVCSTWRDVIMKNGVFWSIIPIVSNPSGKGQMRFELSLQRAGGNILHLAIADTLPPFLSPKNPAVVLKEHGPRFRTINISMDDEEAIQSAIDTVLKHVPYGSLSELSIQLGVSSPGITHEPPQNSSYIISRNSPEQVAFASMIQSLSTFRLYGVDFHWDTVAFSSRLVELRIEQVALGCDDVIYRFVQALGTATNLRDLKIIAVSTFYRSEDIHNTSPLPPITLPALQSLVVENLYLNTLERLLPMIAPGSHRLILFLSQNSRQVNFLENDEMEDGETVDFDGLIRIIAKVSIDTLAMTGEWLAVSQVSQLLRSIPTLKVLKMDQWSFGSELCKRLTRANDTQTPSERSPLPALQKLQLSLVEIYDDVLFQEMIVSYPLCHMILGGSFGGIEIRPLMVVGSKPIQGDSGIVRWLREKLPDLEFHLIEEDYRPSEFYGGQWRLW